MEGYTTFKGLSIAQYHVFFRTEKVSKDTIKEKVSKLNLCKSLVIVNAFSTLQYNSMFCIKEAEDTFNFLKCAYLGYCNNMKPLANDCYSFGIVELFSKQSLLNLTKWLLAYANDTVSLEAPTGDEVMELLTIHLMLADYLPAEEVGSESVENEYSYLSQYYATDANPMLNIVRGYELFVSSLEQIEDHNKRFEQCYKTTIKDYYKSTLILFSQQIDPACYCMGFPLSGVKNISSCNPLLKTYVNNHSTSVEEARASAIECIDNIWDYRFIYTHKHILKLGEYFLPLSISSLSNQLYLGLFWKICGCYKGTEFQEVFGGVFEKYIQKLLSHLDGINNHRFINERDFPKTGASRGKTSDGYILKGENLLIFECKGKSPLEGVNIDYKLDMINKNADRMIICPAKQVDDCYNQMLKYDSEFIEIDKEIKNIYIATVCSESMQITPYVWNKVNHDLFVEGRMLKCEEKNNAKEKNSKILNKKIKGVLHFSSEDVEMLCSILLDDSEDDIFNIIKSYLNGTQTCFSAFLYDTGKLKLNNSLFKNKMSDIIQNLT
ncbi:MAG: hypothetical protein GX663_01075 [Clostridiales bacterium]|nr:hypothetical protein [Clostridiales bacterium]